jgi:phage N-6-adenine-methyltransferase
MSNLPKIADTVASGAVQSWEPQEAKLRDKQARLLKEYARAILDWDMLDQAVDQEIGDQQNLVTWWDESVRKGRPKKEESFQDREKLYFEDAERISGIPDGKVSKWRGHLKGDRDEYRALLRGPSYRKAMAERGSSDQKGASGTGENEWFTPSEFIELARTVLGAIDLDPASSVKAQKIIQAERFYTKKDNGLQQEWHGRIWLNPPYAQPLIADFVSKLCEERRAERVSAAILLTHNYTDTSWFHEVAALADAICFTRGRVKFYEGNKVAAPTQGQAFSYFGDDVTGFARVFRTVGFVVVPVR